ncbi:MAG: hypothetical protein IPM47_06860 [Sphingobacteriales bacterium]|nr:MAG: hypothetical protein IPM47_06860 [Sphingobacteriales bacterium]
MINLENDKLYHLLLRSLEEDLTLEEQQILNTALQEHEALKKEQQRLISNRNLLAGQVFEFSDGFEDRVMTAVGQIEAAKGKARPFDSSLAVAFRRVAVSGVAAILLLLALTYYHHQSLSVNALTGLSNLEAEDLNLYYSIEL